MLPGSSAQNRMKWDDALDVWGVHGIGESSERSCWLFASKAVNGAGADGLLSGNGSFFVKELVAVALAAAYAFVFTYIMLSIINMLNPVRVSEEDEKQGLDLALHGEKAYDEGSL
jgi:Amt family ammonium transporter